MTQLLLLFKPWDSFFVEREGKCDFAFPFPFSVSGEGRCGIINNNHAAFFHLAFRIDFIPPFLRGKKLNKDGCVEKTI